MRIKKKYHIGISCIGSGVGQSIINSLKLSNLPIITIGFGDNPFAFGAYDCDIFDSTPSIYDSNFIDEIISKCKEHHIDLLIPSLDDEVLLYAVNEQKFKKAGINAIFPKIDIVKICRDKEKMSLILNKISNNFVKSFNMLEIKKDIENGLIEYPFIAKPKGGFASRDVIIIRNEKDLSKVKDHHIIQELAIPEETDPNYEFYMSRISKGINPQVSEISIQIVFDKTGAVMGRMMSYNKLNNGVPIEILPYQNQFVWDEMENLIPEFIKLGIRGPLNIQGRITKRGLKLFEMNPRFTGITGLRALMGFNEVENCVKEWLDIDTGKNQLKINYDRFGVRQTADKSIPFERNERLLNLNNRINVIRNNKRKSILVTGASGYLGRNLVQELIKEEKFDIILFGRDKTKIKDQFRNGKNLKIYDDSDLINGRVKLGNVDLLLHLGFARPHLGHVKIADSISFTSRLFVNAVLNQVPSIINISSQSVYGQEYDPPWREDLKVAPKTTYGMAKFAMEEILKSLKRINHQLYFTSIRLGALSGGAEGLGELDFLSKIVKQSIKGETIKIYGGNQKMERLDIRDAIEAIKKLIFSDSSAWKPEYNLGSGEVNSLKEIAEFVIFLSQKNGYLNKSKLKVIPKEVKMNFGLDSTLFRKDFSWKPKWKLVDTIESLIKYHS